MRETNVYLENKNIERLDQNWHSDDGEIRLMKDQSREIIIALIRMCK